MNGCWQDGRFVLASAAQEKIARLSRELAELREAIGVYSDESHDDAIYRARKLVRAKQEGGAK